MNIHKRIRSVVCGSTLTVLAVIGALPVAASHSISVPLPPYSEEALTWCGPATAQMIMAGYPSGACSRPQDEAWLAIQASQTESVWDTDPHGLRGALVSLCPPPGGSWSVFSNVNAASLMHSVAYWMTQRQYPVAVVLGTAAHNSYASHQEHWVAVRGVVTDDNPVTNPAVNLELVWFTDPAVPLGDPPLQRLVTGSTWYSEFTAVTKVTSSFNGKFVAVIEPPPSRGRAVAPAEALAGRVIAVRKALRLAARQIRSARLSRFEPFRKLARARPMEPLLVNPRRGGYFLIPLTLNGKEAIGAILLNAYTGGLQEIGTFAPARFVSQKEAVARAVRTVGKVDPKKVRAVLLSTPEAGGSRYRPAWRLDVQGKSVIVRQEDR